MTGHTRSRTRPDHATPDHPASDPATPDRATPDRAASDSASPDDATPDLGEAFWAVARRLRRLSRDSLAPQGILPSQSRALVVVLRHGPIRLSELSDHLHIAPRSTTEVVDALEAHGLVSRRPDPDDRRATLVDATPSGRHMGGMIRTARAAEADKVFAGLSAADRAHLARILGHLAAEPGRPDQ